MTDIKIPDDIKNLVSYIRFLENKRIEIKFGANHNNKEITLPFNIRDSLNSLKKFEKQVKTIISGLSDKEYYEIENAICNELLKSNNTADKKDDNQGKKREVTVNKYSQNGKGDLIESILIANQPFFISIISNKDGNNENIKLTESFIEQSRILKPPYLEEYLHNPYEFESIEEIKNIEKDVYKETIFTLYRKVKTIISKYIDQEEHIIKLIAINIIFTYFQDRFSTTHYVGIFGDNGSGKSSIGDVVEALSYRAVNTTDPTPANIYRSLGSVEAGQLTLILDEAEKIDQSQEMMTILKTGYDFKKQVSRINQFTGKPEKFYTYCSKFVISEKQLGQNIARGVIDRTFVLYVYVGLPQFDIKEILNPTNTGGEDYKKLLKEINDFRKLLFVYRLVHFKDKIENIDIGIKGRNKELVKPCLQLFYDTKEEDDEKTYQEIKNTFEKLLKMKNAKKQFTLESALLPTIINLMEESRTRTIRFSDFWNQLHYDIKGYYDERKPHEYITEDFGTIYRTSISNSLQKLGIDSKRHNKFTELIFDSKKIMKNAAQYNITIQIKLDTNNDDEVKGINSERCVGSEDPLKGSSEGCQASQSESSHKVSEMFNKETKNCEFSKPLDESSTLIKETNEEEGGEISTERSLRSPVHSQSVDDEHENDLKEGECEIIIRNIFRIGRTDTWGCKKCQFTGDKWFMRKHPCKGLSSNQLFHNSNVSAS